MSNLEAVWKKLSGEHEAAGMAKEAFSIQLVESTPAARLFATWGGQFGGPGLLVDLPLKMRKAIRNQLSSRVFTVQVAEFPGLPPDRIGVMTSLGDASYQDLFQLLCSELSSAVCSAPTDQAAAAALQRVIDRWRHFVERRSAPLSPERVRGLIGEAAVLMRLMSHAGPLNALIQWTGPHDALRDFELGDASVEVKTFQAETGSSVRITSPDQLEPTSHRPVYLAVIGLSGHVSSGRTLPEIVGLLSDTVVGQPGGSELLDEKLAQYGYLSAHASMYTEAYVIGDTRLYTVRAGFPRLLPSAVPAGLEDVKFSVRLAAIEQFRVKAETIIGSETALERLPA